MKRFIPIILSLLIVGGGSLRAQEYVGADIDYVQKINNERKQKNERFRDEESSPLTKKQIKSFSGISYYDVDDRYRVLARYREHEEKKSFLMPTSTDRLPEYRRYAEITFDFNGKEHTLQLYQNVEYSRKPGYKNSLFLPFTDKSNGFGSYGGGRYLDVEVPEGNEIWIDFNEAYNPYCSYNHNYSCPIPPEENDLDFMILAGERSFNDH